MSCRGRSQGPGRHMPEEINRRLVDAIAGLLCAPGRARSLAWIAARPMRRPLRPEMSRWMFSGFPSRTFLPSRGCSPRTSVSGYVFATLHRAELTADPVRLIMVLETSALSAAGPARAAPPDPGVLASAGEARERIGMLTIVEPVGYLESLALTRSAALVVTDRVGFSARPIGWVYPASPCGRRPSGPRRWSSVPTLVPPQSW